MWYVELQEPVPGIRHHIFVFHNELEAEEFQSCFCSRFPGHGATLGKVGEATEVFEDWSF